MSAATLTLLDAGGARRTIAHGLPNAARRGAAWSAQADLALAAEGVVEVTGVDVGPVGAATGPGGPAVLSYAAVALVSSTGRRLGVLEVVGWSPRPALSAVERETLADLAVVAVGLVDGALGRTELEALRREHEHRLDHDPLTGALTRRGLVDRLEHALSLVHRTGATLTVVLLERPGLRALAREGRAARVDGAYLEIVARLREGVRDHDLVARWDDEQFVVVLQAGDGVSEPQVAGRLGRDLERALAAEDGETTVRASVGVATYPQAGEDALGLLGAAQAALVTAQLDGGGVAEAPHLG